MGIGSDAVASKKRWSRWKRVELEVKREGSVGSEQRDDGRNL
ncbi:predicted protein [Chaetomium globosum CBS 148.51]|uniref:Uncharacterized protein n=1 Tax=Chaetomium globosum (strain ATCC 6205 / CBS 148.51 / DSM 1962 / NBRC 6347 / NRRL 1970) TaxID=306901 RepID=Q2HD70_CHAGB|nr:uncharacterized protein CHGG_01834 [Chaetomium globosum CBS 148.51]EAQ93599.1 predicted protein [Chaetomium globosum CBS 148.51]